MLDGIQVPGESEIILTVHEDYKAWIAAHALDALDAGEARSLEEHLAGCAECRSELYELRGIVSSIALSAPAVEPPTELRDRIIQVARSTPQERREQAQVPAKEPLGDGEDSQGPEKSKVVPFVVPKREGSRGMRFLALAACLAFAAAAIALFIIWQREKEARQELARVNNTLNQTQNELARERELREMLSSPDARLAQLSGTESAPQASGKFAVDRNTGRAVLLAYNLPAPPADKEYQLWYIADGKPLPGGVFMTDAKGNAEKREVVPPEGRTAGVYAVTLEPRGGLPAPSGKMYLKGPAS